MNTTVCSGSTRLRGRQCDPMAVSAPVSTSAFTRISCKQRGRRTGDVQHRVLLCQVEWGISQVSGVGRRPDERCLEPVGTGYASKSRSAVARPLPSVVARAERAQPEMDGLARQRDGVARKLGDEGDAVAVRSTLGGATRAKAVGAGCRRGCRGAAVSAVRIDIGREVRTGVRGQRHQPHAVGRLHHVAHIGRLGGAAQVERTGPQGLVHRSRVRSSDCQLPAKGPFTAL